MALPNEKAIFHTFVVNEAGEVVKAGSTQEDYIKFNHPAGYEVVVDRNSGEAITDHVNMGTFNYFNPETGSFNHPLISSDSLHKKYDVEPYFEYGNSAADTTTSSDRYIRLLYYNKAKNYVPD